MVSDDKRQGIPDFRKTSRRLPEGFPRIHVSSSIMVRASRATARSIELDSACCAFRGSDGQTRILKSLLYLILNLS